MGKDYTWVVTPYYPNEAKRLGLSPTLCESRRMAEECARRLNIHSGTSWYVKETPIKIKKLKF